MTPEQNKKTTRRLIEEVFNPGQLDRTNEFFAPNFVDHVAPPGIPANVEGIKMFFGMLRSAFPDFKYTIEDVVAEGDMVTLRTTGHGTMKGEFLGMPPTGKHASWSEIHTGRLNPEGKFVEHWANVDQMGMLQQLGLAPTPGAN